VVSSRSLRSSVKEEIEKELNLPPRKRSDGNIYGIVIRDRVAAPLPPRGHLRLVNLKKEIDWVPPPPEATTQIALRSNDDLEEYPGHHMAMRAFYKRCYRPWYALACSRREAEEKERRRKREGARLLGLVVDLGDDDDRETPARGAAAATIPARATVIVATAAREAAAVPRPADG
jgi:hypothetical protein